VVIDKAVIQWHPRLRACVRLRAHGGHSERLAIRTVAHLTVNHACAYWTLMHLSDLTKLAVAVADVDPFC